MNNPLISVIVPVYKSVDTLERCVMSLKNQNYSNIEILLVEDGSPDASGKLCDSLQQDDNRIRVIHQPNGGASAARNKGLKNANGEYVCFVDSDDYVDGSYIENFISGLDSNTDLVFQGITEIKSDGGTNRKIPEERHYKYPQVLDGISDINKYSMFGYVCNKLYRLDIIKHNHLEFDKNISISEDRIFALKYIAYINEMHVVAKSSYFYEMQTSGLTCKIRTYVEQKVAADKNLKLALALLKTRNSIRFFEDTKRMYIMSAYSYLTSLFRLDYSWFYRFMAIRQFRKKYAKWIPCYNPVAPYQKVLRLSLMFPTFVTVTLMSLYWQLKNWKNEKNA